MQIKCKFPPKFMCKKNSQHFVMQKKAKFWDKQQGIVPPLILILSDLRFHSFLVATFKDNHWVSKHV